MSLKVINWNKKQERFVFDDAAKEKSTWSRSYQAKHILPALFISGNQNVGFWLTGQKSKTN
jgi:hypothetical protein